MWCVNVQQTSRVHARTPMLMSAMTDLLYVVVHKQVELHVLALVVGTHHSSHHTD
jgi:hypothetical protein